MSGGAFIVVALMLTVAFLTAVVLYMYYMRLWLRAHTANCPVPMARILRLSAKRIRPHPIVTSYIRARKANIDVSYDRLEECALAGAHVDKIIKAVIEAKRAGLNLTFDRAVAIDLQGKDILEEIRV